ncbi:uncharacterized protein LOC134833254 isoform X2 [Culicoides brevitarsis]|uniref:uncharacterized protein LOC134833254 isoform X2 n=1 Tax=Culicoides brevitarsis TaxID=469753 RepID=UPI00307B6120
MSVVECCIKSCNNKKVPESSVSFHYMRFDWILDLKDKNAIKEGLTKKLICSKHFKPELVIERNGREFLVPNAVPTEHLLKEPDVDTKKTKKHVLTTNKRSSEIEKKTCDIKKLQLPNCYVHINKMVLKCFGPNCGIINNSHTYVAQISSDSVKSQYIFLCKQHKNVFKSDKQFHLRKTENALSLRKGSISIEDSETEEITVSKRVESKKIVEKRATRFSNSQQKENVLSKSVKTQKKSAKEDDDGNKSPSEIWKKIVKQSNTDSKNRVRPEKRNVQATSEISERRSDKKVKVEPEVICLEDSDSDDEKSLKKPKDDGIAQCCIPGCKSSSVHSIITVGESPNFEHLTVCLHHRDCFKNIHAVKPIEIHPNEKSKYGNYVLEEGEVPPSPEKSPERILPTSTIVASPSRIIEPIPVQRVRPTVSVSNTIEVNAQGHTLISRKCTTNPSGSSELFVLEEWSDGSKIYTPAPPGLPLGKCTKEQIAFYKARIPPSSSTSIIPTVIPDNNEILSARHIVPSVAPTLPIADISKSELVYIGGKPYLLTGVQGLGLTRDAVQPSPSVQPTIFPSVSSTTIPKVLSVRSLSDPSSFPRATIVSANSQKTRINKNSMNTSTSFEDEEETILSDHIEPVPVALRRVESTSGPSRVRQLPQKSNKTTPRIELCKSSVPKTSSTPSPQTSNTRKTSFHLEKSLPKPVSKNPTVTTNTCNSIQRSPPKIVKPPNIIKTISLNSLTIPKFPKGLEVTSIPAIDDDSDNEDPKIDMIQNEMEIEDPSDPLSMNVIESIDLNKDPLNEDYQPFSKRKQKSLERKRGGSLPFPSSLKRQY